VAAAKVVQALNKHFDKPAVYEKMMAAVAKTGGAAEAYMLEVRWEDGRRVCDWKRIFEGGLDLQCHTPRHR
jgi:hypothetical protein